MEARVHISYGTKEIDIEGTEDFVREQLDSLDALMSILGPVTETAGEGQNVSHADQDTGTSKPGPDMPESFGEYLNQFKKGISQEEQMLIAGYFVQQKSDAKSYTTKEANDLLKEQGIKVGNASQSVADSKAAKRVFALERSKFRVSQGGIDHINTLRNS